MSAAHDQDVARNFLKHNEGPLGFLHAATGAVGECGELIDYLKKVWVYGNEFDRGYAILEIGDILWYLSAARSLYGLHEDGQDYSRLAHNLMAVALLRKEAPAGVPTLVVASTLMEACSDLMGLATTGVLSNKLPNLDRVCTLIFRAYAALEALMQLLGTDRAECEAANIAKLRKRYPQNYTDAAALERVDQNVVVDFQEAA